MNAELPDTLAATVARAAAQHPDARALRFEDRGWTYDELWRIAGAAAETLRRRSVGPGDRVGLFIGNRPEWLFWTVAVAELGAVAVPINPAYTAAEIRALVEMAELGALIVDERLAVAAELSDAVGAAEVRLASEIDEAAAGGIAAGRSPGPARPDETAIIYFSSGSTGQPKGIVHSHRNLMRIADISRNNGAFRSDDGILIAMPLAFVFASVVSWMAALRAAAGVVLQERFNPSAVLAAVASGEISVLLGVPSMYRTLVDTAHSGPALSRGPRLCLTGGDQLTPELSAAVEETLHCRIFDLYGLSETPYILAHTPGVDDRSRPLSCGRPVPGVETRLVDEDGQEVAEGEVGELLVRTPFTFAGYFRNREATGEVLRNGWFATGDLMRRDADGYFFMVERKKALIKRSGFNVLPGEVEAALRALPGVADAAVIGVPDEALGQRVKAFVVAGTTPAPEAAALIAGCAASLAKYKLPDEIAFLPELPKGATGKVLKKNLR
jgi:long-chain acyl-CoA synthetase